MTESDNINKQQEQETREQLKEASSIHASRDEVSAEEQLDAARKKDRSTDEAEASEPQRRGRGRTSRARSSRAQGKRNASNLFQGELIELTESASPSLRSQLKGTIALCLQDGKHGYLFDWSSSEPRVSEFPLAKDPPKADCTLHFDEKVALDIASGELNPQIAMLSDKIRVSGKHHLAVYFFNLFDS